MLSFLTLYYLSKSEFLIKFYLLGTVFYTPQICWVTSDRLNVEIISFTDKFKFLFFFWHIRLNEENNTHFSSQY